VSAEVVNRVNKDLRGGLRITDVGADSLGARAGFQRGDILIGLHQWETISSDNVIFVLNHPDLATFAPLKYFLIRDGQLRRGHFLGLDCLAEPPVRRLGLPHLPPGRYPGAESPCARPGARHMRRGLPTIPALLLAVVFALPAAADEIHRNDFSGKTTHFI